MRLNRWIKESRLRPGPAVSMNRCGLHNYSSFFTAFARKGFVIALTAAAAESAAMAKPAPRRRRPAAPALQRAPLGSAAAAHGNGCSPLSQRMLKLLPVLR